MKIFQELEREYALVVISAVAMHGLLCRAGWDDKVVVKRSIEIAKEFMKQIEEL